MIGFEDLFRFLNIALILLCFYQMIKLRVWWFSRLKEERLILVTIPLLLLMMLLSTIESIIQNVGFGSRVMLYTPVLILCIFSVVNMSRKVKKVKRKEVQHDDGISGNL